MRGGLPRMSTKHGAFCILSCNKPGGRRPGAQPWGGVGTQGQFYRRHPGSHQVALWTTMRSEGSGRETQETLLIR